MKKDVEEMSLKEREEILLQAADVLRCMYSYYDDFDYSCYFEGTEHLKKGLSYRVLIKPDIVYSRGVTEHEYLDSLDGKGAPHEMCWSLIYRKLKGNRGCTMITDYEYKR